MYSSELKAFIREKSSLFWSIPEDKKEEISPALLVETILNYGSMDDVRKLIKLTFLEYPFRVEARERFEDIIRIPELIDLAAMKAYALGRWSKWKDYVDLYFILKKYFSVGQISTRASEIFDQLFSEKLFRTQLNYFDDIDHSESVEYVDTEVPEEEIRALLSEKSIDVKL